MTDHSVEPIALPGALLRQSREAAGLSVEDMAQALNLAPNVIQALEADQYDELPGLPFVRGYLTNYHRKLGLPKELVLDPFDAWRGKATPTPVAAQLGTGSSVVAEPRQPIAGRILAGIVLLAIVIWATVFDGAQWVINWVSPAQEARNTSQVEQPVAAAVEQTPAVADEARISTGLPANEPVPLDLDVPVLSAQPEVEVPAPAEPVVEAAQAPAEPAAEVVQAPAEPADEGHRLQMRFSGDSWIEVTNGEGQRVVGDLKTQSDTVDLRGPGPFRILVGNAAVTQVVFDGEVIDIASRARQNVARIQLP